MNRIFPIFAGTSTVYSGILTYMLYDTKQELIKKEQELTKKEQEFNTQLNNLQKTLTPLKEEYDKEHKPFGAKDLIIPGVGAALYGVFHYLK